MTLQPLEASSPGFQQTSHFVINRLGSEDDSSIVLFYLFRLFDSSFFFLPGGSCRLKATFCVRGFPFFLEASFGADRSGL